jgi:hypothetical protein
MGARAEYSLDGERLPLPQILVAGGRPDVQRQFENFLTSQAAVFVWKFCPRGLISFETSVWLIERPVAAPRPQVTGSLALNDAVWDKGRLLVSATPVAPACNK